MIPARISGAEPRPIGAPADWSEETHGHCGALFVRRENIAGIDYMRSAWEADPTEAMLLVAGARITLGVSGWVHPVVQLGVGDLPADFEPTVVARRFTTTKGQPAVRVEMLFPHAGGRRAFAEQLVQDNNLAFAVADGVSRIEALARKQGWIE